MAEKEQRIINEVWVDGKKMHSFDGKRIPKDVKRLRKLKGCKIITRIITDGGTHK